MKAVIDTLFNPILSWLQSIREYLTNASVPFSQSLDLGNIFAPYSILGPQWQLLITTIFALAFIYFIILIVSNGIGLIERLRGSVKWW